MIPHRPDPPSEPPPSLPPTSDRRESARYGRRFEMLWQILGSTTTNLAHAEVFDVSVRGVGLLSDTPLLIEALVLLRLPTTTLGWSSHLVRVKRCNQKDD